jgi:hypothetical protein
MRGENIGPWDSHLSWSKFWICLTCTSAASQVLNTSSLVSGTSCKSSDLMPSFAKLYPVLLPFHLYTQIRDEIGNTGSK